MTDQMFVFLCRDVRKFVYDYRRGELQAAESRKFEEHVASCEKCRDYVDRLEGMLDAAAIQEYVPEIDRDDMFGRIVEAAREESGGSLDRDSLFERITAEIDLSDARPSVAKEALELAEPQETLETEREEPAGPTLLYVVAALAAGVLIGIGLGFLYPTSEPVAPQPMVAEKPTPKTTNSPVEVARTTVALAELGSQPTPSGVDDVKVFGDPTASWDIRTQGARRKMELKEGTVLVEFVPDENNELEFVADRFTVRVTGTIFYASTESGLVGVVTGSVEVQPSSGETVTLVGGQEWVDGEGLRQAPAQVRADAGLHINVIEHEELLERKPPPSQKPMAKPDPPRPPMSKEVGQTPRARLRASADDALRDGRHAVAAQYYERMVEELSAADPANASLRLDLARIYIRHLGAERRAIVHLRRFVQDRPDDPLTTDARNELCRIASAVGQAERQCQ